MSGSITTRARAGVATMSINGDVWDVADNLKYGCSGYSRETQQGQSGVDGFSLMPKAGYISATLRDRADVPVSSLNDLEDASIVVQQANGKTVYGDGMWKSGDPCEVNTKDGTFEIRFEGPQVSDQ